MTAAALRPAAVLEAADIPLLLSYFQEMKPTTILEKLFAECKLTLQSK